MDVSNQLDDRIRAAAGILEEHCNPEGALVIATMLNKFVNNADTVKMANMDQIVNVIAPLFTNQQGLFLQSIFHPPQLFSRNTRGASPQTFPECPSYDSKRF
jgi:alpha-N-arabinofuranosidase